MMQPLSRALQTKHELNRLCAEAVQQQIARGKAEATQLRNRRRHLAKQVLKRIPNPSSMTPRGLLHAFTLVLAMWGLAGLSMPRQAQAAPVFKHISLAGFDVGDYAAPNFADIDGDGDLDAFVGADDGTVRFYRNTGSNTAPVFVADGAGNPLAGVDVGLNAVPSFVDIDADGDLDAFVGADDGTVRFYRNTGSNTAPVFVTDAAGNPLAGFDVGSRAAPGFTDIDGDGDLDLFVGETDGAVRFYRNTGSNTVPVFVADGAGNPLAGVDVGLNAVPGFADIDRDGDLDVFVGERYGTVKFYRNTGSNTVPVFVADGAGNPLVGFDVGYYAALGFADIDGDGDLDAFIGEVYGTVRFYRSTGSNTAPVFIADGADNPLAGVDVGSSAAPDFADIDGDGDLDLFVGEGDGTVKFYRNTGSNTVPLFVTDVAGNPLAGVDVGNEVAPDFADIDGDGDLDAFVGEIYGTVKFYRNTGSSTAPVFVADGAGNPLAGVDVSAYATPSFVDIDGDGDLDAFVGANDGTVRFYRNTGSNTAPVFVADVAGNPLAGIDVGYNATLSFADIDRDGDLDLFAGETDGAVKFYRNTGSNAAPVFVADGAGDPLAGVGVGLDAAPSFVDIDGDGDLDAFVGDGWGAVKFFENFEFSSVVGSDTTPPVITLTGANPLTVAQGSAAFTDPGATVADDVDTGLTATITGMVDTDTVGVYTLIYTATDAAGNTGTVTRTVNVTDQTPPVITAPVSLTVAATSFSGIAASDVTIAAFLAGVTATDNIGVSGITHDAPVTFPVGNTTVTFTASDAAGNSSTRTAVVTVTAFVENTPAPPASSGGGGGSLNLWALLLLGALRVRASLKGRR